jgi:TNF receptor-associated factor 4
MGELGKLIQHISVDSSGSTVQADDICPFVPIDCSHCHEKFERRFVEEHKTKLCPKRPFCCEICNDYESTFEKVTTNHKPVCPSRLEPCSNECGVTTKFKDLPKHLAEDCPLEVIDCSFSFAGCEAKLPRKDLPAHISDNLAVHMSLQAVNHRKSLEKLEARVQDLEMENSKLKDEVQQLKVHMLIVPVQFVLDEYACKRESGDTWNSQPFYTHLQGYKMYLNVGVNGDGNSKGTHISVFTVIMRGEFDHQLKWPFYSPLNITLLDQEGDKHHVIDLSYDEETPKECTGRVVDGDENVGWGTNTYIAHEDLHPKYYKNDSLIFKISDMKLNSI